MRPITTPVTTCTPIIFETRDKVYVKYSKFKIVKLHLSSNAFMKLQKFAKGLSEHANE